MHLWAVEPTTYQMQRCCTVSKSNVQEHSGDAAGETVACTDLWGLMQQDALMGHAAVLSGQGPFRERPLLL